MKPLKERNLYRLLMGPGPCNPPASAREASSLPLLGHLDPTFGEIMDELQIGLRYDTHRMGGTCNESLHNEYESIILICLSISSSLLYVFRHLFGTTNEVCFAASGTGSSGMELLGE